MLVFIGTGMGCFSTAPQRSVLMEKEAPDIKATAYQLRLHLDLYAQYFSLEIERVADDIIANTDDYEIKKNALIWKMYAIPAGYNAIFLRDPLAANFEIWVLCAQMTDYFQTGIGNQLFGPMQFRAIQVSEQLEAEVVYFAKSIALDTTISEATDFVYKFAEQNPLDNHYFARASTMELFAEIIGVKESGLGQSISDVEQILGIVDKKLSVYFEFLPKQARWQAEYVLNQMMIDQNFKQATNDFTLLRRNVDQITHLLNLAPAYVDSLSRITLLDFNRQRIETLTYLQLEKEDVLKELRAIILKEIDFERKAALDQIDKIAVNSLDRLITQTEAVINRLLIKMFIGLLILGAGFIVVQKYYLKT